MTLKRIVLLNALACFIAACAPKTTVNPEREIAKAVIATVASLPTQTPYPTLAPPPTQQIDLNGIFCEYQFCVGHPGDVALFDANPDANPSSYGQGKLAAYKQDLFLLFVWGESAGSWAPDANLALILQENGDTALGNMDVQLIGPLNVAAQALTPPTLTIFKLGLAATWRCGNRDFLWKVYTLQDADPQAYLNEALRKFKCNP
jgi:hypothetical protein